MCSTVTQGGVQAQPHSSGQHSHTGPCSAQPRSSGQHGHGCVLSVQSHTVVCSMVTRGRTVHNYTAGRNTGRGGEQCTASSGQCSHAGAGSAWARCSVQCSHGCVWMCRAAPRSRAHHVGACSVRPHSGVWHGHIEPFTRHSHAAACITDTQGCAGQSHAAACGTCHSHVGCVWCTVTRQRPPGHGGAASAQPRSSVPHSHTGGGQCAATQGCAVQPHISGQGSHAGAGSAQP